VAEHGPEGRVERRFRIDSLLLKNGKRIARSALDVAESGVPGVSAVVPGAAQAQMKGLRVGDIIDSINGESFVPMDKDALIEHHHHKQVEKARRTQSQLVPNLLRQLLREKNLELEKLDEQLEQQQALNDELLALVKSPAAACQNVLAKLDSKLQQLDSAMQDTVAENDSLRAQIKVGFFFVFFVCDALSNNVAKSYSGDTTIDRPAVDVAASKALAQMRRTQTPLVS